MIQPPTNEIDVPKVVGLRYNQNFNLVGVVIMLYWYLSIKDIFIHFTIPKVLIFLTFSGNYFDQFNKTACCPPLLRSIFVNACSNNSSTQWHGMFTSLRKNNDLTGKWLYFIIVPKVYWLLKKVCQNFNKSSQSVPKLVMVRNWSIDCREKHLEICDADIKEILSLKNYNVQPDKCFFVPLSSY